MLNKHLSSVFSIISLFTLCPFTYCHISFKESSNFNERHDFKLTGSPSKEREIELIFAVKQNNIEIIEALLHEISSVDSPKYGQYLTRQEVGDLTYNDDAIQRIRNYLSQNDVKITRKSLFGEYLFTVASISKWEMLLNTTFHIFQHVSKENLRIIRAHEYYIHNSVINDISTVFNVIDFPNMGHHNDFNSKYFPLEEPIEFQKFSTSSYTGYVYPGLLSSFYNIPKTYTGISTMTQSIYASLEQSFSPSDLVTFQNTFSLSNSVVQTVIGGHKNDSACYANAENCNEANLDIQYLLAVAGGVSTTYWYDESSSFTTWITTVATQLNPPLVHSISYGQSESYLSTSIVNQFNTEAIKLNAMGATIIAASGDDGAPSYTASINKKCQYNPSFPASSPYVTAVGATMGPEDSNVEIACQSTQGSGITTGGGFSNLMTAPSFQSAAISTYFSSLTSAQVPKSGYSKTGRGLPDVALLGNKYIVVIGGKSYGISGTSASAPVFAGMVSLVNSIRKSKGMTSVGWINPTIYSINGTFANDITSGDNKCTRTASLCCYQGFYAAKGWDPLTGFGSVDYQKFCKAFTGDSDLCSSAYRSSSSSNSFWIVVVFTVSIVMFFR